MAMMLMCSNVNCQSWITSYNSCSLSSFLPICMYVCMYVCVLIGCAVYVYWDWLKYSSLFDICTMSVVFRCAFNQINLNFPLNKFNGIDCSSIFNWIALLIVGKLVGLHRHRHRNGPLFDCPRSINAGQMTRKQLFICDLLQRREIGRLHRNEKHQLTEASNGLADQLLVHNNVIEVII